eukprot:TRINITY_DN1001_c0_g1_i2.p1 TRINITY_DN1001_c0_g1~~TRINITY_DN1001_c0_g1_i2.p1  ORF type:complete len:377 (-),score=80.67 TRINITY_DN1001_c0_g1_i2:157-1263(-)
MASTLNLSSPNPSSSLGYLGETVRTSIDSSGHCIAGRRGRISCFPTLRGEAAAPLERKSSTASLSFSPSVSSSMKSITPTQVSEFHRDGYVIVRQLFDSEEMQILMEVAKSDPALAGHRYQLDDGEGLKISLALWNKAGDDVYGAFARCSRIVDAMEELLGDEVYHYHSKMIMKEAIVGGSFAWHQDYGYWYKNGCLFPDMGSVMIAVDANTNANGCLQVLAGSHKLGRLEHGRFGDQTGADPERIEQALKVLRLEYAELAPGDALFFHANTLHRSDQNRSPHPRWSLLCCFNTKHNSPYKESHHPAYHPINKLPDSAIKALGRRAAMADLGSFLNPDNDKTIRKGEHNPSFSQGQQQEEDEAGAAVS